MKYIKIEHVKNDQIMLIQDEWSDLYYVVVESAQNYSFAPDFVSKAFKSKTAALKTFTKILTKYTTIVTGN